MCKTVDARAWRVGGEEDQEKKPLVMEEGEDAGVVRNAFWGLLSLWRWIGGVIDGTGSVRRSNTLLPTFSPQHSRHGCPYLFLLHRSLRLSFDMVPPHPLSHN